jgi:SEC-C motif-containing protein
MRSRFSAFALGSSDPRLDGYLRSSWHPATRPATLELDPAILWRRLQIVDTADGGPSDDTGVVEFRASFRDADVDGTAGVLHERSRFARVGGRWTYLDGDILD